MIFMKELNYKVFLPPFAIILFFVTLSIVDKETFLSLTTSIYDGILSNFGWLLILTACFLLILSIVIYFSPLGRVVIGGRSAVPILSKWHLFTISLCTTIGSGLMFWAFAEPIQHMLHPPESMGLTPLSFQSALYAMTATMKHWTFLSYGLYTIGGLMFGFCYYNMGRSFSLGTMISPLVKNGERKWINRFIDIVCLFCIGSGIAAGLGVSSLNLNGAVEQIFNVKVTPLLWGTIIFVTITVAVISATTGLQRGIKKLSNFNVNIYFLLIAAVFILGPTVFILSFGVESTGEFFQTFLGRISFTGAASGDTWPQQWTLYTLGGWMAWTPITAVFLGKISYGHRIKDFILINLIMTSVFSALWLIVLSGTTVYMQLNLPASQLVEALNAGYQNVAYQVFRNLPFSDILIVLYALAVFISFVTAIDSNTTIMAAISTKGISHDNSESPGSVKLLWGIIIGALSFTMVFLTGGVTGCKMLANIGGFPIMFLLILIGIGAIKIMQKPYLYDLNKDDYDIFGHPIEREVNHPKNGE